MKPEQDINQYDVLLTSEDIEVLKGITESDTSIEGATINGIIYQILNN